MTDMERPRHRSRHRPGHRGRRRVRRHLRPLEVLASRIEDRVEKSLGALLITRLGDDRCVERSRVLEGWDERFDADVRSRMITHLAECDVCRERRAFSVATAKVLPGKLPAPTELRQKVRDGLGSLGEPLPLRSRPEWAKWAVVGGMALVLGLIGTAISAAFEPLTVPASTPPQAAPTSVVAVASTTTTLAETTTSGAVDATTSTSTGAPAVIEVSTDTLDFGEEATSGEFHISNTGGAPGDWVLSASSDALAVSLGSGQVVPGQSTAIQVSLDRARLAEEGDIAQFLTVSSAGEDVVVEVIGSHVDNPIIHNPRANPVEVRMDGGSSCSETHTTVSARIRDTSSLASAMVRWSPDGSGNVETPMNPVGNDMFEAVIGPFSSAQTAAVRIVAFDELDNAGGANISVSVVACP